jgi:hypothetical protein
MTLKQFIKDNKQEIDKAIAHSQNHVPSTASCYCNLSGTSHTHNEKVKLNYEKRRLWVLNDYGLYNWAKSEGVKI